MTEHEQILEKIDHLQQLILIEMNSAKVNKEKLDKYSFRLKKWSLGTSGIITVLLGWSFLGEFGKNAAIFASAFLTIINGLEVFRNYTQRAQQEKHVFRQLSNLYGETILYLAGNSDCKIEDYNIYKAKFDVIIEEYIEERKKVNDSDNSVTSAPK